MKNFYIIIACAALIGCAWELVKFFFHIVGWEEVARIGEKWVNSGWYWKKPEPIKKYSRTGEFFLKEIIDEKLKSFDVYIRFSIEDIEKLTPHLGKLKNCDPKYTVSYFVKKELVYDLERDYQYAKEIIEKKALEEIGVQCYIEIRPMTTKRVKTPYYKRKTKLATA